MFSIKFSFIFDRNLISTLLPLLLLIWAPFIHANVEKTIFIAPPATSISLNQPSLNVLHLIPLSLPHHPTVRTYVNVSFPSESPSSAVPSPWSQGTESWFLLENLRPSQRHELRICWSATSNPTTFRLDTFTISETMETTELISSLSAFAYERLGLLSPEDMEVLNGRSAEVFQKRNRGRVQKGVLGFMASDGQDPGKGNGEADDGRDEVKVSVLFLRIRATADFFTTNQTLMSHPPPVKVDLILDPYLWNIFPESLVATARYLVAVAGLAWAVSTVVWRLWNGVAEAGSGTEPKSGSGSGSRTEPGTKGPVEQRKEEGEEGKKTR